MATASTVRTRVGPLHVEVDGDGPPAVLWHSLFVDSTTWARLRPALAARRTLILVDGPGHGHSGRPPGPFTMSDCADAAAEVLASLAVTGPVDWLGNAWGGHVGVTFAAERPEACRSLLTIATPIHALPASDRRSVRLAYVLHRLAGPRAVAGPLTDALLGRALRRADLAAATAASSSFIRADRRGMRQAIRSISLDRADATALLPAIKAPTLMATGADDAMCTPADTATWAAQVQSGHHVVLSGAGHLAPLFDPRTSTVITDFWQQTGR
ncbi:alpha/beta fold hydrolase [Phytohabitans flavus]|uniref:Putative hydrolase, alpha/beta fold protein n=1 Tax=Phytohabitans flavus TaxID=1076124 RepID=A0A6F8XW51_9ACTN|nr:alpha/beta fold hydrolase [Phytohabitans flavus]BCB78029.1 putative hydrolase, alpha/beta fold protein [Phytohabitans flavus]